MGHAEEGSTLTDTQLDESILGVCNSCLICEANVTSQCLWEMGYVASLTQLPTSQPEPTSNPSEPATSLADSTAASKELPSNAGESAISLGGSTTEPDQSRHLLVWRSLMKEGSPLPPPNLNVRQRTDLAKKIFRHPVPDGVSEKTCVFQ